MSYGYQRKQWNGSGTDNNKVLYDLRDNLESQARRINGLIRTVKQLHEHVILIEDKLYESGHIPRGDTERKHTLSHASSNEKQSKLLYESFTSDEEKRLRSSQRQSRHGMVSLHDKGQRLNAKIIADRTSFDVSPPRSVHRSEIYDTVETKETC